jgi:hypothetical protein
MKSGSSIKYQKSIFKIKTLGVHLAAAAHVIHVEVGDPDEMTWEVFNTFILVVNSKLITSHRAENITTDTKK